MVSPDTAVAGRATREHGPAGRRALAAAQVPATLWTAHFAHAEKSRRLNVFTLTLLDTIIPNFGNYGMVP